MRRREFLSSAGIATPLALPTATQAAVKHGASPPLLTLTGAIAKTNRGPFDPARDILMGKHGVKFDKAFAIDYPTLAALPSKRFDATLEYDRKRHALSGPLLTDVLALAGAWATATSVLHMRAVDGYAPTLTVADARRYQYIVALRLDGQPLALGGLGPLWAVYEADRFPEMTVKPVDQRFATCPWSMYHIEVKAA
jgi:hypothetical protein